MSETEHGTFGRLETLYGEQLCVTLEEPWKGNARYISCIPAGIYKVRRRFSPKRRVWVWELVAVPGRTAIQIHIGNTLADIDGCILVGLAAGSVWVNKKPVSGVVRSRDAFNKLMTHTLGWREWELEVVDAA